MFIGFSNKPSSYGGSSMYGKPHLYNHYQPLLTVIHLYIYHYWQHHQPSPTIISNHIKSIFISSINPYYPIFEETSIYVLYPTRGEVMVPAGPSRASRSWRPPKHLGMSVGLVSPSRSITATSAAVGVYLYVYRKIDRWMER